MSLNWEMDDKSWYVPTTLHYSANKREELLICATMWLNLKFQVKEARLTMLPTVTLHVYSFQKKAKHCRDKSQLSGCQEPMQVVRTEDRGNPMRWACP